MASIIVTLVSGKENYYRLPRGPMVIGSGAQLPVQVADEYVSVKHLKIAFHPSDNSYSALDLKSKNGTRINDRDLADEITLTDGDRIEIGQSRIAFYDRDFVNRTDAMLHHKKPIDSGRSTVTQLGE